MKNTVINTNESTVQKFMSTCRGFDSSKNESKLKDEDYKNLLLNEFLTHVRAGVVDEDEFMYRDGFIISYIKESLGSIHHEAESWKRFIRGFKVTLYRDRNGFGFNLIIFPTDINQPVDSRMVNCMSESLDDSFYTTTTEEARRAVFKLVPRVGTQSELMRLRNIPMFAFSLGLELDEDGEKYSINFYWDESSEISPSGIYKGI